MRILVTGGTGTVGETVVSTLAVSGHDVVVFARESSGDGPSVAPTGVTVVQGDVLDTVQLREVMSEVRPEAVVHAAAITPGVDREISQPDSILAVNTVGVLRTLSAFADLGVGRFVHLSSVAAYGAAVEGSGPLRESTDDGRPRNLYELSKQSAEIGVRRIAELRGLDTTCLRLGDVFGIGEKRTPFRDALSAPYQLTALAAAGEEARLPRAGGKEWIYTRDVAEAVRCVVETSAPVPDVMNVTSGHAWSLLDWCRLLQTRWPGFSYRIDPESPNVSVFSDNPPLRRDRLEQLGFRARFDLPQAFEDYLAHWTG